MKTWLQWQANHFMSAHSHNTCTHRFELIADIQLVGVEQHEDEVTAGGKPLGNVHEVVVALDALLLTAQHTCVRVRMQIVLLTC